MLVRVIERLGRSRPKFCDAGNHPKSAVCSRPDALRSSRLLRSASRRPAASNSAPRRCCATTAPETPAREPRFVRKQHAYFLRQALFQVARDLEDEKAVVEAQLTALRAEATAREAAAVPPPQPISAQLEAAAHSIYLDEATTRRMIDEQLRAAGWEADTDKLHYSRGTRPAKHRNLAIAEWPTESGPTDYALFIGLELVGIVEAKRLHTDIPAALGEAHRVLKRGGRFFCLEFSTCTWPGFSEVYDAYSHRLVPKLGKMLAKDEESYRYLIESIRRFPPMPEFERMIRAAGFTQTKVEPILGGLVAIHSGWKA